MSNAGDVNGDGWGDLIIGAPGASPYGNVRAGETYVVFGSDTGFDAALELSSLLPANGGDGTRGFVVRGIDPDDHSGASVSAAGDFNGDGLGDLIIGARGAAPNGNVRAGETYVVFGTDAGFGAVLDLATLLPANGGDGSRGFVLNGIDADDESGASVSSAGDVNGDGFDDLIISAPFAGSDSGETYTGEAYVVFGREEVSATVDLSTLLLANGGDGSSGFVLHGIPADVGVGAVSSAGDVNGDGIADVVVGTSAADTSGGVNSGQSYVIFGTDAGFAAELELSALLSVNGGDGSLGFVLNGIDADDQSGCAVSSAGDVNGDRIGDLIIGAVYADPDGDFSAGETYVVFGTNTGFNAEFDLTSLLPANGGDGSHGFVLKGVDPYDYSGLAVDSAGDMNGDGITDLVIGAPYADPGGKLSAGEAYVVFGTNSGFTAELNLASLMLANGGDGSRGFIIQGNNPYDSFGASVSSAGDINGDGLSDLVIGAPFADPAGRASAGETYVILGSDYGFAPELDFPARRELWRYDYDTGLIRNVTGSIEAPVGGSAPEEITTIGDSLYFSAEDVEHGRVLWRHDLTTATTTMVTGATHFPGGVADPQELTALDNVLILTADKGQEGRELWSYDDSISSFELLSGSEFPGPMGSDPADIVPSKNGVAFAAATPTYGFVVNGAGFGDDSGGSVSSAGDVNGDGLEDLIIGAFSGGTAGEAYVVFGTHAARGELDLASLFAANGGDGSLGFVLRGIDADDYSGCSVSSAGDVNHDGLGDIIIGAFGADPNGNNDAGETYVVYGSSAKFAEFDLSTLLVANGGNGSRGFVLQGISAGDSLGYSVSSAGDVNGDGIEDIFIGAYNAGPDGNGNAGEAYVIFGNNGGAPPEINLSTLLAANGGDGSVGFVLKGVQDDDLTGYSISAAGDVNGDGVGDVIIGAPGAGVGGKAYVVFGNTSPFPPEFDLATLLAANGGNGSAGFVLNGEATDFAGFAVSWIGDFNGDAVGDLIIGDPAAGGSGKAYVVFGDTSPFPPEIELASLLVPNGGDGSRGLVLNGIEFIDFFASSVSGTGDVNNDGLSDVLVGAKNAAPGGINAAGQSYVVFGTNTPLAELDISTLLSVNGGDGSHGFVIDGMDADDNFGVSVSSAGDVNGDLVDDMIIGAYWADPGGLHDAGETYVLYGTDSGFPAEVDLPFVLAGQRQLWRYDLVTGATVCVTGTIESPFGGPAPQEITSLGESLFFTAEDRVRGRVLWRYDLETSVTTLVTGTAAFANGIPDPQNLAAVGEFLFFSADDGHAGRELWSYSPSTGDVRLVRDIAQGSQGSDPADFFFADGLFFAVADDGIAGRELWSFGSMDQYRFFVDSDEPVDQIDFGNQEVVSIFANGDPSNWRADEGSLIDLTASTLGFSNPTYEWTVTGGPMEFTDPGSSLTASFRPLDEGVYSVQLTVIEDQGLPTERSVTDVLQVFVQNVAPTIAPNQSIASDEGQSLVVDLAAFDPANLGAAIHDTLTYVWELDSDRDGTFEQTGEYVDTAGTRTLPFSWIELNALGVLNGTSLFDLRVTAWDDAGGVSDPRTYQVTIDNVPPTADAGASYSLVAGSLATTGVVLDASASSDPVDQISYLWKLVLGNDEFVLGDTAHLEVTWSQLRPLLRPEDLDVLAAATTAQPAELGVTVRLEVTDADGGVDTDEQVLTITNQAPTVLLDGLFEIVRGTPLELASTPGDGDNAGGGLGPDDVDPRQVLTVQWDLGIDNDPNVFHIDATGELLSLPPDILAQLGLAVDGDEIDVMVRTSDELASLSEVATATIRIPIVNDGAPVFTSPSSVHVPENTAPVMTIEATDVDLPLQTITFSISGGADAALFSLVGDALSFQVPPDFEHPIDANTDNIYEIEITADDGNEGLSSRLFRVSIDPINDSNPVFTSPTSWSIDENATLVGVLTAIDDDAPAQSITFTVTGGPDASRFTLDGDSLVFVAVPDFEHPTDVGSDNIYDIEVTADDGYGGLTTQAISVAVQPVNEYNPQFTSSRFWRVDENTLIVGTVKATDDDAPAQAVTFSISGGADASAFTIHTSSGQLQFVTAPDYEVPADAGLDGVYEVQVTAADGTGGTTMQALQVTVAPVNDHVPVFTSSSTFSQDENTTSVGTLAATDGDLPAQTVTFVISGGADASLFRISGNGLAFRSAPDYEHPADANLDNVYQVEVTARDGLGGATVQTIQVTVLDVFNEHAPVFESPATLTVPENSIALPPLEVTDADLPAQSISLAITGGADASLFVLNGSTLEFIAPPDYELPADQDGNNVYELEVTADDGAGGVTTQSLDVIVTDVAHEPLVVTLPSGNGADDVVVRLNGANVEVFDNGSSTVLASSPLNQTYGVTVVGAANEIDHISIDFSFGGFFTLDDGVRVSGGTGDGDLLTVIGQGTATGRYVSAGSALGHAAIEVTDGPATTAIVFTGFEPLEVAGLQAFEVDGALNVGAETLTLNIGSFTRLGLVTTLAGGTITALGGVSLGFGQTLRGFGTVDGRLASEAGSTVQATGDLQLGDATSSAGVLLRGDLQVGSHTVTLLDANDAVLGSLTTLGAAGVPGTLVAANGALVDFGNNLNGFGTVVSATDPLKPFIVNRRDRRQFGRGTDHVRRQLHQGCRYARSFRADRRRCL